MPENVRCGDVLPSVLPFVAIVPVGMELVVSEQIESSTISNHLHGDGVSLQMGACSSFAAGSTTSTCTENQRIGRNQSTPAAADAKTNLIGSPFRGTVPFAIKANDPEQDLPGRLKKENAGLQGDASMSNASRFYADVLPRQSPPTTLLGAIQRLAQLRTVEALHIPLVEWRCTTLDEIKEGVLGAKTTIDHYLHHVVRPLLGLVEDDAIMFRVTGLRREKEAKQMQSLKMGHEAGGALVEMFPTLKVGMVCFNVEFHIIHDVDRCLLSVVAHKPNLPRSGLQLYIDNVLASEKTRLEWCRELIELDDAVGKRRTDETTHHATTHTADGSEELELKRKRRDELVQSAQHSIPKPAAGKLDVRSYKGDNSMSLAIASLLVHCAAIQPGDVVLDPLGGTGTTLVEGYMQLLRQQATVWLCGDLNKKETKLAMDNLRSWEVTNDDQGLTVRENCEKLGLGCDGGQPPLPPLVGGAAIWDATQLPFRSGTVDVVISDLPFGRRCLTHKKNMQLYPALLKEFYRVLRPATAAVDGTGTSTVKRGSRCVLLTLEWRVLQSALCCDEFNKDFSFKLLQPSFSIDMGGLTPHVFVLEAAPLQ